MVQTNADNFIKMGIDNLDHPQILFGDYQTAEGNEFKIGYATTPEDTVPSTLMIISSSGKVSIGSSTPQDEFLSVVGSEADEEIARFQNNNSISPQGVIIRCNITTPAYDSGGSDAVNFGSDDTTRYLNLQRGPSGAIMGGIRGAASQTFGTLVFEGDATGTTSDIRYKENIINYTGSALYLVDKIDVINFNYIGSHWEDTSTKVGFKAQQLDELWPHAVHNYETGNIGAGIEAREEGHQPMKVNEGKLTPLLVKALQELTIKVETLEAKIEALENV